jgi:hypothetical protein
MILSFLHHKLIIIQNMSLLAYKTNQLKFDLFIKELNL